MEAFPQLVAEILELIRSGNERVLEPLLARVSRIADDLEQEQEVTGEEIREALGLWARYLNDVRGERIRAAIGKVPPGPDGGIACGARIRELRDQLSAETARVPAIQRILGSFESGHFGGRGMVVGLLRGGVASDRAWARFEEEYVAHCLVRPPPATTIEEVRSVLAHVRDATERLAADVQAFVERKPEPEDVTQPVPA